MNSISATNPAEFSVLELMGSGRYTVPLYQRNFAWGEVEIVQLLQDLCDANTNENNNYYLGSLVVHAHADGHFEIIDGQQRHTTLCILLAVLKKIEQTLGLSSALKAIDVLNLGFDCRSVSETTLKLLFDGYNHSDQVQALEPAILSAYKIIQRNLPIVLRKRSPTETENWRSFTNFILGKVKLLRVIVPADTDLNHYFEIMNSRGEQLEMHEILKARLMNVLDPSEQNGFATLWDACADMQRFALIGFSTTERSSIFGGSWNECPLDFDDYLQKLFKSAAATTSPPNAGASKSLSLAKIADSPAFQPKETNRSRGEDAEGRFGAVINFPNFLLQVLLVKTPDKKVSLDDKHLLQEFKEVAGKYTPDFVKTYAITLLRLRLLWDRFIIKSRIEKWSLKRLQRDGKNSGFSMENSFVSPSPQNELVMLQSMFHVSFPAQPYKYWLTAALNYLHNENLRATTLDVDATHYLNFLECLSDRFFYGRHGEAADNSSDSGVIDYRELIFKDTVDTSDRVLDINTLHKGTGVENFIFNRLDYLLWKRCQNKNPPKHGNDLRDFDKLVEDFRFTFRSSVEHYYPQHPRGNNEMPLPNCDNFGNLCLISHSNNSRYSDFLPKSKKELREASKSNESLKLLFMMSYPEWGPEYEESHMAEHEAEMIETLKQRAQT